jgi:hypothetical protein
VNVVIQFSGFPVFPEKLEFQVYPEFQEILGYQELMAQPALPALPEILVLRAQQGVGVLALPEILEAQV